MNKYDNIPTWEEICDIHMWVRSGCPIVHRHVDPKQCINLLNKLMNWIALHIPIYAYGDPEWKAELKRLRELENENG